MAKRLHLKERSLFVASMIAALSSLAYADVPFVGVDIGTRGPNLNLGYSFNEQFSLRAQGTDFTYGYSTTQDNTKYKGDLSLRSIGLLGDWFPNGNSFRLTAGAMYLDDRFYGTAQSTNGFVTINHLSFPVTKDDYVNANVHWQNNVVPYLGIGFGNPAYSANKVHFAADLGVIVTGHPEAKLTATGPNSYNPIFQYELQQEQNNIDSDMHKISVWPVVSVQMYVGF